MTTIQMIKAASHVFTSQANAESFNNRLAKPLWPVQVGQEVWLVKPKHAAILVDVNAAEWI